MKTSVKVLCCSLILVWAHSAAAGNAKSDDATRQKSKASMTVKRDRATVEKRLETKSKIRKQREQEAESHKAPPPAP